ncbi:MAG: ASCH domain-containing protein [Clostridia bacterium]|nr:ASCH domain-containing protein [Clostridia bacterium]
MEISSLERWHFELSEGPCNALLALVLEGKKKATCSSKFAFDSGEEVMPEIGKLSVITDWDGNPRCVVKTTNIRFLKFNEMTFDIAKLEGEDECLESWQKNHIGFFTEEGKELGYEFTEDLDMVFEEFEVVEIL